MTHSRNKGKRGERELASVLCASGFPATRGAQHRGGPDSPDVLCPSLPGIHFEAKRCERFDLYGALMQARGESAPGQIGVVAHRRNDCEWVAVLRLNDFLAILRDSGFADGRAGVTVQDAATLVCGPGAVIETVELSRTFGAEPEP